MIGLLFIKIRYNLLVHNNHYSLIIQFQTYYVIENKELSETAKALFWKIESKKLLFEHVILARTFYF